MLQRTDGALKMAGVRRSPCTTLKNDKTVVWLQRAAGSNPLGSSGASLCCVWMFTFNPVLPKRLQSWFGASVCTSSFFPHCVSTVPQIQFCFETGSRQLAWGHRPKQEQGKNQLEPLALAPSLNWNHVVLGVQGAHDYMGSLGVHETGHSNLTFSVNDCLCPVCNLTLAQRRMVEAAALLREKHHWMGERMKSIQSN